MVEKERVWNDLEEYVIKDCVELSLHYDGDLSTRVEILKRLKPGQYFPVRDIKATETNTTLFLDYIERLRKEGLDIGRGNAEYGYKMPLPKKDDSFRKLIIFRRKIKK